MIDRVGEKIMLCIVDSCWAGNPQDLQRSATKGLSRAHLRQAARHATGMQARIGSSVKHMPLAPAGDLQRSAGGGRDRSVLKRACIAQCCILSMHCVCCFGLRHVLCLLVTRKLDQETPSGLLVSAGGKHVGLWLLSTRKIASASCDKFIKTFSS